MNVKDFIGMLFIIAGMLCILFAGLVGFLIWETKREIANMKYPIPDDMIIRNE